MEDLLVWLRRQIVSTTWKEIFFWCFRDWNQTRRTAFRGLRLWTQGRSFNLNLVLDKGTANSNSNNKNNQVIHNTFYLWVPNRDCSLASDVFSLKTNLEPEPLSLAYASCFPIVLAVIWRRKSSLLLCSSLKFLRISVLKLTNRWLFYWNKQMCHLWFWFPHATSVLSWKWETVSLWGTLALNSMGNTSLPE